MQPGPERVDQRGVARRPGVPLAWGALLLGLFSLGGVVFGLVFLRNLHTLSSRGVTVTTVLEQELPHELPIAKLPEQLSSRVHLPVPRISAPRLPAVGKLELPNPLPA